MTPHFAPYAELGRHKMTLSVAEYSAKFEEARLRSSEFHVEDQFTVCTRFVNGLRFDIQRMVRLHAPHTIEDAYQKALKVEKFNRPSSFAHTDQSKSQSMSLDGNTMPANIRSKESSLRNSLPVASHIASKASNSSIVCHKCHHKGHIASREQNFRYFDRNIGEISEIGGDRKDISTEISFVRFFPIFSDISR